VVGFARKRLRQLDILIYAFREREDLFDMYEAVIGCAHARRLFPPRWRLPGFADTMPQYKANKDSQCQGNCSTEREPQGSLLDFIEDFTQRFPTYLAEYHTCLTDNRIWKQRTVGIGVVRLSGR
jgi:NADH-quinone oxidoreductase subunit D